AGIAGLEGECERPAVQVAGQKVVPLRQPVGTGGLGLLALTVRARIFPQIAAEEAHAYERSAEPADVRAVRDLEIHAFRVDGVLIDVRYTDQRDAVDRGVDRARIAF